MYQNIKNDAAFDYADFAWERMEACCGLQSESPKDIFEEAAVYLNDCDQKHVNAAILWQDDQITIHCRLPNSVRDIYYRLEKEYECPLRARKITVWPYLLHGYHAMGQLAITPDIFDEEHKAASWWTTRNFFIESPALGGALQKIKVRSQQ